MASFATDVKNEAARLPLGSDCCRRAELAALLRMGANIALGADHTYGLHYHVENAAVARRALTLFRHVGEGLEIGVTALRRRRLKKTNSYALDIAPSPATESLFEALGFLHGGRLNIESDKAILKKPCCRAAYLRGAFLGGGSVSRPEASNHLEIVSTSYSIADGIAHLLRRLDFPAGMTDRKETYIVYLKEGDAIADFLGMIGAEKAVEAFEIARNVKEVREQVNRIVNCETANLQKAVDAAGRQLDDIRTIEAAGRLESLGERARETAAARLAHPEASLADLSALLSLSKSALAHRMKKLHDIAETIREGDPT